MTEYYEKPSKLEEDIQVAMAKEPSPIDILIQRLNQLEARLDRRMDDMGQSIIKLLKKMDSQ